MPCRGASRKRKFFGSGGSMVAKLKLEIDGRAPPGVEPAAFDSTRKTHRPGHQ